MTVNRPPRSACLATARVTTSILLIAALATALPLLAAESPPNIVLVMADDVGYECFGTYGSRQYFTPRIDKLADGGVRCTNCYSTPLPSTLPWCSKHLMLR